MRLVFLLSSIVCAVFAGGTVLEANFSDAQNSAEHFAMLRNQLAALTNMPMGNTTTDINTSKPTRSVAGVGYVQSFPTLAARPGSWGSLQRQLLPFQGQVRTYTHLP